MAEVKYKNKNSNTFRFKSFGDRVNEIDIRRLALYHIGHENEELPEDNETYFHQTLKKWMVLNLTDEYGYFSRKCLKIVTLPQLVHQKDFVIDLLLERLATATNLSLQPLLELLYVLARDLREEFYPYFQRVLDRLICLLNTKDAEQLEWTLVCLAHLFKTLKPYLKRNIGVVFHAILPLLDEQRYEEYVTNFAVECFSFIARDIRDFKKFLEFILETVAHEQVEVVQGCGRLFFEIVRGVQGLFHSIASEFLQFIFEALTDEQRKDDGQLQLLADIVRYAVSNLLEFIAPHNMVLFWTKLCVAARETKNTTKLSKLIVIFVQVAEFRNGRYLAELQIIVPTVLEMIGRCDRAADEESLQLLGELVSHVVLASAAKIEQLDTCRLLKSMLAVKSRDNFERFVLLISSHTQFDILVLPTVIKYFEVYSDVKAMRLLATLVLRKQPLALNAIGLENWKPYELQLKNNEILNKLQERLEAINFNVAQQNEENVLLLIILPHIKNIDTKPLQKTLQAAVQQQLKQEVATETRLAILALLVETQIHLPLKFNGNLQQQLLQALLPHVSTNLRALGCLDQLCKTFKLEQGDQRNDLITQLSPLLSTHNDDLRLTAAHCLATLYSTKDMQPNPYQIIYEAASIKPTIHNYREQLLLLQRLETSGEFFKSFQNIQQYKDDILRFLLGLLYHNFKFIWEPALKLVEEYAKVMDIKDFWRIFKEKLITTNDAIQQSYENATTPQQSELWLSDTLNDIIPEVHLTTLTQQELLNYRNLLWLHLPQFGTITEIYNRDLVTIFLQFVQDEYRHNLEQRELTWDLSSAQETPLEDVDSDLEVEEQEEDTKTPKYTRKRKNKSNNVKAKSILQALQTQLGIFVAQPNPKALYRERELHEFYMDLLAGPNTQLQKLALDCVFTYKSKALTNYKEQLYALLDEKKFKDELINFKLDAVSAEYREPFMQILLRLLYGKMITKGTQRNVGSQVRKGMILRFLGQCSTTEIFWFLQMAFGKYADYTNADVSLEDIPKLVENNFDLTAVWSPKKLQSIVNLLELIRKEFGGLMDKEFQLYMLKLLIFIGSVCAAVLRADTKLMHAKMPAVFKNVKNAALQSLVNFFAHIEEFDWLPPQIECITEVFIWPHIALLSQECIHSPTPLFKLLLQWSERPKHFEYLQQQHHTEADKNIFYYIIELLLNEKAKPAVRKPILAIIERLLVAAEHQKDDNIGKIALELIKPFVPHILKRLKMNFSTRSAKRTLDKRDLNILSLLTSHVEDPATCDSLLQLLLPILITKSQTQTSEDVVCQIITTLSNLIKRLDAPETYLLKIGPLFEQVQEVTARKLLCQLVADVAKKRLKQNKNLTAAAQAQSLTADQCEKLKDTARLMLLLNAWDKRWIEQPDYDKRLDALKEVATMVMAGTVDMELGVLVIYNCFYFIKYDKDIGLRDNASEHLRLLVPRLVKRFENDQQQLNFLVGDVLINLLRRLIRDNNDNVRNEGIRLLGVLTRECSHSHEILMDLAPLADKNDAEVDFYENITHLQSHRHGRALLRFCSNAENMTKIPNARTLTQFILPLASRYLLAEKHASKHTLVDAAIEAIGVCCQLLPWQHYHALLRYYLMKMRTTHEYQRQCVRIVVRILDAFHFDLSQSQTDAQELQKLRLELKEKTVAADKSAEVKTLKETENDNDDDDEEETQAAATNNEEDDLDNELDSAAESATDEVNNNSSLDPILKRPLVLTPSASRRVMSTIATILIPTLNRSITEKSSFDNKHKVNRKRLSAEREEEEIMRVPIALALVKLMQKLPKEVLDASLSGVFMKVCTFLRSPLKSVRMLTRDILKKIMLALGASYLSLLLDHLQTLLTRGFQVHVLAVTLHGVLDALREKLQPEDIESCLSNILEVSLNDIFGEINAEKEIEKISAHAPEAKPSAKSYLVLHIAARNIRENCLLDLLMPFKQHLIRSHSRKLILKIQDCFAKIVGGLVENLHISRESLLIFIYGIMSESIVDLLPGTQKRVLSEQEKEKMRRARPDCYIITPAPGRFGAINKSVKTNAQANAHILIEFGLEMLNIVLKRKKLVEVNYQPFLHPVLPLLRDSLKSTHIRVTTFALKCFSAIWNDEYELPALEEYLCDVVARMFEILQNFSTFGATKQEDNMQLVKSAYKAVVALLRKCTNYELTAEQIDQLVLHVEHDLYEGDNQAMCFSLLKAMIARKVDTPPIHEIMRKLSDLSIVSHSDFIRDESRAILLTYIMEYTLKRRVDQILKFFTVQLCYKLPVGRQSAVKFLHLIIKKFPLNILAKRAEFLYLSLGTRLVNDEDPECRKSVAECIELMITRLEKEDRQRLFDMTLLFFDSANKPSVREMAAVLCSRFLNAEKQSFAARIKLVLPTLVSRLTLSNPSAPGRFVKAPGTTAADDTEVNGVNVKRKKIPKGRKGQKIAAVQLLTDETATAEEIANKQRANDHEIIQMQYCLLKIFEYCTDDLLSNDDLASIVDELAYESQRLLAHDHSWVRSNAAKIIALILSNYDFDLIGNKLKKLPNSHQNRNHPQLDYIYLNPEYDIKSLVLDLCAQMMPGETPQPMIDEIVKIFLFIANMLRDVPFVTKQEQLEQKRTAEEDESDATKIHLNWLVRNIRFLINKELAKAPHCISMRSALFTLIEGLITLLNVDTLCKLAPALLATLVREMSEEDQNVEAELRQIALRVGSKLRKRIGSDIYDKLRTSTQTKLMVRRADRKRLIAQEKVNDPVKAAKRKIDTQERKKVAKKLKTNLMRGKVADVKQKLKKRKRKAEEDLF